MLIKKEDIDLKKRISSLEREKFEMLKKHQNM